MPDTLQVVTRLIQEPDYVLDLRMPLFSKARPRLTKGGHAYMPEAYRQAQAEMRRQVIEQWKSSTPALEGPIAIYLKIYGEARGDGDNIVGALLDAAGPSKGVPGILWEDDPVSVIPLLIVDWEKASKTNSRWLVHILRLDT